MSSNNISSSGGGRPATPSATNDLYQRVFEDTLDFMHGLKIFTSSPKFFIIFAHDSSDPQSAEYTAHADIVRKFVSWFKRVDLDVDSDRSPHGWSRGRGQVIQGASNDIVRNQLCLLPRELNEANVDNIIIFGSELLGKYLEDEEATSSGRGLTYRASVVETCRHIMQQREKHPEEQYGKWLEKAYQEISKERREYQGKYGTVIHEVLTEIALVDYRIERQSANCIIPLHFDDPTKCLPKTFTDAHTSILRRKIEIDPSLHYESFFKILLRFECFEEQRPLLETILDGWKRCEDLLKAKIGDESRLTEECLSIRVNQVQQFLRSGYFSSPKRPILPVIVQEVLKEKAQRVNVSDMKTFFDRPLPAELEPIDLLAVSPRDGSLDKRGETGRDFVIFPDLSEENTLANYTLISPRNGSPAQCDEAERELVSIPELFQERCLAVNTVASPKRIFIQGLPGIGKSTLTKKIMYEYSCNPKLAHRFELVVRIPLRRLASLSHLAELLRQLYFADLPRGDELATKLADWILAPEPDSQPAILLILDGLDEVQDRAESQDLLLRLLNASIVIVTSRFEPGNDFYQRKFDLRLEATGLNDRKVRAYINCRPGLSSSARKNIMNFLESNPVVRGITHVPLHLDIMCFRWESIFSDQESQSERITMTSSYQFIEQYLWRHDIPRLEKYKDRKPITPDILKNVRVRNSLLQIVAGERQLLGQVALNLIQNQKTVFNEEDISTAIDQLKSELIDFENNLDKLSFVRKTVGSAFPKDYSFSHLTIQEYFAALHLVANQEQLIDVLREQKYNRRYAVIWRFVAGMLSDRLDQLEKFYQTLQEKPRDLIGVRHAHLSMDCLGESCRVTTAKYQQEVYNYLSDWLEIEFRLGVPYYRCIASSTAFPETILRNKPLDLEFMGLVSILDASPCAYPRLWNKIFDIAKTQKHLDLELLLFILKKAPSLPRDVIERFLKDLRSSDEQTILIAMLALASSAALSRLIVAWDVIERVLKEFWSTRPVVDMVIRMLIFNTAHSVRKIELQEMDFEELVRTIGSKVSETAQAQQKYGACLVLRSQPDLPSTAVERLIQLMVASHGQLRYDIAWVLEPRDFVLSPERLTELVKWSPGEPKWNRYFIALFAKQSRMDTQIVAKLRQLIHQPNSPLPTRYIIELANITSLYHDLTFRFKTTIQEVQDTENGYLKPEQRPDFLVAGRGFKMLPNTSPQQLITIFLPLLPHRIEEVRKKASIWLVKDVNQVLSRKDDDPERSQLVDALKNMFEENINDCSWDIACLLQKNLEQVVHDALPWLLERINYPKGIDYHLRVCRILRNLPWHEDRSHSALVVKRVLKLMKETESDELRAELGTTLRAVVEYDRETLEILISLLFEGNEGAVMALRGRECATKQILDALGNISETPDAINLVDKALQMLNGGYSNEFLTFLTGKLRDTKNVSVLLDAVYSDLIIQDCGLPMNTVRALTYYSTLIKGSQSSYSEISKRIPISSLRRAELRLWTRVPMKDIAHSAEDLTTAELEALFKGFIQYDATNAAVWVDKGSLWYDTPEGQPQNIVLRNEARFLRKIRKAQGAYGVKDHSTQRRVIPLTLTMRKVLLMLRSDYFSRR